MRRPPPPAPLWLHEIPERYADWMEALPWDWYGTFTFAEPIHPDVAGTRYDSWAVALQEATGFRMQHARALEWQRRGVVHFHSLIWGVKRSTSKNLWAAKWQEIGGGWAMLRPYDREQRATYYLAKYTVKGGEIDHLTFGPPPARPDDVRMERAGGPSPAGRSTP